MQPRQTGATMVTRRLIGGALAALSAQAAQAADLPIRTAPALPTFVAQDWSGLYLGAQVGTVFGGRDRQFASGDGGLVLSPNFGGRGGRSGNVVGGVAGRDFFTGAHAGYNWQGGALVVGLEGDVSLLGRADDILASGRGRVGFATPDLLVYGTAGVAYLSLRGGTTGLFLAGDGGNGGNGGAVPGLGGDGGSGGNGANGGNGGTGGNGAIAGAGGVGGNGIGNPFVATPGGDRLGYVAGGGIEMRLSPQVSAGIEALYYGFDGAPLEVGLPRSFLTLRGRLSVRLAAMGGPVPGLAGGDPAASWAGGYLGGHFGGLHPVSNTAIDRVVLAPGEAGAPGTAGIDGGGGGGAGAAFVSLRRNTAALGGLHLGYNWQSAAIVYGGEADASFSADDAHKVLGSIRARLGATSGSTLFFGTAGVAFDRNEGFRTIAAENGGDGGNGGNVLAALGGAGGVGGRAFALRNSATQIGFVIGGGVEAKITPRLSAGVEALYYNLGRATTPTLPVSPNGGRFLTAGGDTESFVLRTRLSYSFQAW